MDAIQIIILIGSLCTALVAIFAFCRKYVVAPIIKSIDTEIDKRTQPIMERQNDILDNQKDAQMRLLRLEILNLLNNDPKNYDTILETFDEYKALGGNHYIDAMITKWKKEQGLE